MAFLELFTLLLVVLLCGQVAAETMLLWDAVLEVDPQHAASKVRDTLARSLTGLRDCQSQLDTRLLITRGRAPGSVAAYRASTPPLVTPPFVTILEDNFKRAAELCEELLAAVPAR